MDNSSLKQSYVNMFSLFKKSKGLIFNAFILVLIPVLIINCYAFYAVYGGTGLNVSAIENVNLDSLMTGSSESFTQFQEAFNKIYPEINYEQSAGDVFLDVFLILHLLCLVFEKQKSNSEVLKESLKKFPAIIFLSIFTSWLIYEAQSIIFSSVFMFIATAQTGKFILAYSALISAFMLVAGLIFALSWMLLVARYAAISYVSGKCRFVFALAYCKEVLRGKIWKNIFKTMPYVVIGLIFPMIMQAVAVSFGNNIPLLIILVFLSIVIEMTVFLLYWVFTVPDFVYYEKTSGITKKIQEMINRAMNMRNNQQTEDNNSDEEKE